MLRKRRELPSRVCFFEKADGLTADTLAPRSLPDLQERDFHEPFRRDRDVGIRAADVRSRYGLGTSDLCSADIEKREPLRPLTLHEAAVPPSLVKTLHDLKRGLRDVAAGCELDARQCHGLTLTSTPERGARRPSQAAGPRAGLQSRVGPPAPWTACRSRPAACPAPATPSRTSAPPARSAAPSRSSPAWTCTPARCSPPPRKPPGSSPSWTSPGRSWPGQSTRTHPGYSSSWTTARITAARPPSPGWPGRTPTRS